MWIGWSFQAQALILRATIRHDRMQFWRLNRLLAWGSFRFLTMSQARSIDLQSQDRGLKARLSAANVQESWATSFINHFKLETLDDFIYMIDRVKWQEEIKALLDEVPPLKDSRLILARFRGAFESGLKAIEMSQSPAAKVDDYDDPLPEQQQAQLQRDWQQAYGIAIEPHLEPADSLRARIFREFRRKSLTVLEIKKIKSVLSSTSPASQEQVTLQGSVTLHFAKETLQSINTIIDYYFGLRILANAWAMAGNYLVTDPDSVERRMIKLDDALNYADGCLRDTVQFRWWVVGMVAKERHQGTSWPRKCAAVGRQARACVKPCTKPT